MVGLVEMVVVLVERDIFGGVEARGRKSSGGGEAAE